MRYLQVWRAFVPGSPNEDERLTSLAISVRDEQGAWPFLWDARGVRFSKIGADGAPCQEADRCPADSQR